MSLYWYLLVLFVLLVPSMVSAVDAALPQDQAVNVQLAEANRFLSAEVTKQIKAMGENISGDLRNYQDENFRTLDARMDATMHEAQQRLIVGVIGAVLLGGALIGFFMFHLARKYSYEKYLEDELERRDAQGAGVISPTYGAEQYSQGYQQSPEAMQQMQQPEWPVQQPFQSIGMDVGQSSAATMSQFNNWQVQSPRQGGWEYVPEEWKNNGRGQ